MPIVKMRERGQVTIPAEYRKELGLEENDTLNFIKVGDTLILTPRKVIGDTVSMKFEKAMKGRGLKLDNLLADLSEQRARYNREVYGKKKEL